MIDAERNWTLVGRCSIVVGCVFVFGCGRSQPPTLAGGKPVNHWIDALQDPKTKVRNEAVAKLGNVGAADPLAIPALIAALKDKDAHVRCEAIVALAKLGDNAKVAIDSLTDMQLHDRDRKVRDYAAKGLKRLQGWSEAQHEAGSS